MQLKKRIFLWTLLLAWSNFSFAQQTTVYTEAHQAYKLGMEYYSQSIFGLAQNEFKKAFELLLPVNQPESELLRTKAELHFAKCAVRLDHPDGEKLILDFARAHDPEPIATSAVMEMANYYFNDQKWDKAIQLYKQVDNSGMSKDQRLETKFKLGYAYFVRKKFKEARPYFQSIKDIPGTYTTPANYYYGMTSFFEGKYTEAISSFKKVENTKKYRPHVPYYITQIYFAQGKYDEVIDYGIAKTKDKSLKKRAEINQLVGQAFFEQKDYESALPYLEYAASKSNQMRKEDFYLLGYVQHQAKLYGKAVKNLEQLNKENSKMGQNAMYMLGDAQIQLGDKAKARNAFRAASKMNFDAKTQEESLYNFGKLSYELDFGRDAISALQQIPATSAYYLEAQTMMGNIFLNTRDYEKAIETLDKIPNKTPKLKETAQKVAYFRALQLIKEEDYIQAKSVLKKSLASPVDNRTKALSIYWLGEIAHLEKDYPASVREFNKFLNLAKTINNLPDEASAHTANYTQGYNYLKQKDYNAALGYFQASISGIKRNEAFIDNTYVTQQVLGDATLRAGDCLFKRNKYDEAIRFYDDAVSNKYAGFIYALYQKAIIEGLRGNTTNKILALDNIVDDYPKSEYADNALLQLGITYQEIGKYDQATVPLKKLITNYRNSELTNQALLKLGLITYNQGSLQTAINYYKQVFSHNPTAIEAQAALTALEEIYVDDLGKPDEYFSFLETVPGYDVKDDEKEAINFKAAESQYENGNYAKAITAYTAYLRKYPRGRNVLVAYYHRGESHGVQKQYGEALKDFEYVISKGPSRYYTKALPKAALIAYNFEKDFEKSYQYYTKLEEIAEDDDTRFEAQLGALRSAYRSNKNQAVLSLADKVATNPNSTNEQKAAARFYQGKVAFDQNSYEAARTAFNEVVNLSDNEQTAEARYLIAYIFYSQRDLNTAQQLCLNANRESSNYPYWVAKSVILLADILAEKGDLFNAQAALESLIENYDEDQELVKIAKAKLAKIKEQSAADSRIAPDVRDDVLDMEEEQ